MAYLRHDGFTYRYSRHRYHATSVGGNVARGTSAARRRQAHREMGTQSYRASIGEVAGLTESGREREIQTFRI
jgi:hypothetical protein